MGGGRVVLLNGTTSAGKSTLAAGLQARFAAAGECWLVLGLDDFFSRLPFDWVTYGAHVGAHASEGIAFELVHGEVERRVGPIAEQVLDAYRGTIGRCARAGLNLLVDEVLLSAADWQGWQVELEGVAVRWVQVACPLEVVEARERDRGDRMVGTARAQFDVVHRFPSYDVRVDTASLGPDEAAAEVAGLLRW